MLERTRLVINRQTYRGFWETRRNLKEYGIRCSWKALWIMDRLPTENFLVLEKLLIAIAKRRGTGFKLTQLPMPVQIVGISKKDIPGIEWKSFLQEAKPHGSRGDILGHFIRTYLYDRTNTLDLSGVAGFVSHLKENFGIQLSLNLN